MCFLEIAREQSRVKICETMDEMLKKHLCFESFQFYRLNRFPLGNLHNMPRKNSSLDDRW